MAAICRSTIIKERTPLKSEWALRSLRNDHAVYVGMGTPLISEWLRRSAGICMIEQFSSKLSPWPPLIHNTPILEFRSSFLFCVSKQLISNIGNSSGHPIVPSDPSRFFCWKSASSSSPEFLAGNPFIASFPSVLAKSDLPSRKFGSLSSLTQRPSALKTKCDLYGITYKVPSQTKRLTFLCWKSVCPSA